MPLAVPAGSQLTIRSRLFPPVVIPVGQAGAGGGAGAAALAAIQPAITVTVAGQDLYTFAPAGDPGPGPGVWPLFLVLGAVTLVGFALYGLAQLVKRGK